MYCLGILSASQKVDSSGKVDGFTINGTGIPNKSTRKNIKVEAQRKISMPTKLLQSYTGRYQFSPGPVFEIVLEDNKLFGQVRK